jgi:hypothetical protein
VLDRRSSNDHFPRRSDTPVNFTAWWPRCEIVFPRQPRPVAGVGSELVTDASYPMGFETRRLRDGATSGSARLVVLLEKPLVVRSHQKDNERRYGEPGSSKAEYPSRGNAVPRCAEKDRDEKADDCEDQEGGGKQRHSWGALRCLGPPDSAAPPPSPPSKRCCFIPRPSRGCVSEKPQRARGVPTPERLVLYPMGFEASRLRDTGHDVDTLRCGQIRRGPAGPTPAWARQGPCHCRQNRPRGRQHGRGSGLYG